MTVRTWLRPRKGRVVIDRLEDIGHNNNKLLASHQRRQLSWVITEQTGKALIKPLFNIVQVATRKHTQFVVAYQATSWLCETFGRRQDPLQERPQISIQRDTA
ncbi:MAG: hypothetical protein A3E02_00910 [Candidatus Zambryskibacteria bacterium RIFCSPHIGHO2_12_FULL_38_34]|uniref:Uncharacterized protein n=1 Tax=Candidatus Zambryskibacteria bacterium RIFCSPLOWO2_12_FULL_39_16 TaxID=1802775 RepID=A0A1G2US53_9BACT|nr:MAG: hypothetical protein A3D37_00350 [Candidatus Zambryskibacteria bacterium RIFCSPHIGHO2_02_FULL_38_22]OHA97949.1 MAG: hypothetical protein A3E02_00910 [Candidatus Zambryskibacteria bacterium RIFCSPHIGHO2_12_FULL_38_34]OHB09123.1 MAG: hypothetical protein A3I19_00050 [Candidatus Zambryskibacteria bacterium RIFCSPLOWO2_02_FULL_38_13]OHB12198.1 MAG: hypothetical protein A3G46_00085 [Candidatus Zambryskibacteria bacterium RIFCSPLOWO2_12_FULL_39_16]